MHTTKCQPPREASFALLKKIIDEALPLGLKSIKITGGEPLLSASFFELIRYAVNKKLGTIVETNGTLLDDKCARFL